MKLKNNSILLTPPEAIVEQLVASGIEYVFYNSGSREAKFFNALQANPKIHGILALHEGTVASIAGGYSQINKKPAVMLVHLGAGLSQSLGQVHNLWRAGLPVVILTFGGDTGSYIDKLGLDLPHSSGLTDISNPFVKQSWSVLEPYELPLTINRAIRVAMSPPMGPVHLAFYDRILDEGPIPTKIIPDTVPYPKAGLPSKEDISYLANELAKAKRPLIFFGDGISTNESIKTISNLSENLGIPLCGNFFQNILEHPMFCGATNSIQDIQPDLLFCLGVTQMSGGDFIQKNDYKKFEIPEKIILAGSNPDNLKPVPNLVSTILADETHILNSLNSYFKKNISKSFSTRIKWAINQSEKWKSNTRLAAQKSPKTSNSIRPFILAEILDTELSNVGGGIISMEQYCVPIDSINPNPNSPSNIYIRPAGGSEGYGIGGALGVKMAAPEKNVIGLIGDGSLYYAAMGLWTAVHHNINILYVIANNGAYGVVAGHFKNAGGVMNDTNEYSGIVLDKINPATIAKGFGLESETINQEALLPNAIKKGIEYTKNNNKPYLLNVILPIGLPENGKAAKPFQLKK